MENLSFREESSPAFKKKTTVLHLAFLLTFPDFTIDLPVFIQPHLSDMLTGILSGWKFIRSYAANHLS